MNGGKEFNPNGKSLVLSRRELLRLTPVIAIAVLGACKSVQEQVSITRADYNMVIESGDSKTAVELFTSPKYYLDQKQKDVTQALNDFVNSGSRNITEVQTSYSDGYLTAARANYSPDNQGKGSKIRVKLIQSSQYYYDSKNKEVKKMLEDALKDQKKVHKVNTIFREGYLLAAEVWYFEP